MSRRETNCALLLILTLLIVSFLCWCFICEFISSCVFASLDQDRVPDTFPKTRVQIQRSRWRPVRRSIQLHSLLDPSGFVSFPAPSCSALGVICRRRARARPCCWRMARTRARLARIPCGRALVACSSCTPAQWRCACARYERRSWSAATGLLFPLRGLEPPDGRAGADVQLELAEGCGFVCEGSGAAALHCSLSKSKANSTVSASNCAADGYGNNHEWDCTPPVCQGLILG